MFEWAVIFIVLAIIANVLGVTGIAVAIAPAARFFSYIFFALAIVSFVASFFPKKKSKGLIIDIKYGGRR